MITHSFVLIIPQSFYWWHWHFLNFLQLKITQSWSKSLKEHRGNNKISSWFYSLSKYEIVLSVNNFQSFTCTMEAFCKRSLQSAPIIQLWVHCGNGPGMVKTNDICWKNSLKWVKFHQFHHLHTLPANIGGLKYIWWSLNDIRTAVGSDLRLLAISR